VAARPGRRRLGEDRVVTVPNALTALRLACLPLFFVLLAEAHGHGRLAAAVLLGASALTDVADGYIARRFDQVSKLGKMVDPLVDRALVLSAIVGATVIGAVPIWLVIIVALREAVVLVGSGLLFASRPGAHLDVSRAGKLGAFGMMLALPLFIMAHAQFRAHEICLVVAWAAVAFGQALAWVAAAQYVPKARAALAEGRA
jgi:cardiolipin synthase